MAIYYYDLINALADMNAEMFIKQCENNYKYAINSAAEQFIDKGKRIIMLSGPSSSGKTTSAKILMSNFREKGYNASLVSLDDFYFEDRSQYPLNEDGSYNFESPLALDLQLMEKCFSELIETGESDMPIFDFETHKRKWGENKVKFDEDTFIVVEGIHGLNPCITDKLPRDRMGKIYVSVSSRVYDRSNKVLLAKREIRFLRRLVRDYKFRSTAVDETFSVWPSVCNGENEHIFPFRNQADVKVDTFIPYEICMLADEALSILPDASEDTSELRQKLEKFRHLSKKLMPEDSMLHEFLG